LGWTQQASASALGGDEASLREFLHTGLAAAMEQDDRASIGTLADSSDNPRFVQAANEARYGLSEEVTHFLRLKKLLPTTNSSRRS
jgi:hypothetical protein